MIESEEHLAKFDIKQLFKLEKALKREIVFGKNSEAKTKENIKCLKNVTNVINKKRTLKDWIPLDNNSNKENSN